MMRITLAYAWKGHAPDETVEVPDRIARQLLHDGKARRADDEVVAEREGAEQTAADAPEPVVQGPSFSHMKTAEMRAYAEQNGIEIPTDVRTRRELIATIRSAQTRAPEPEDPPVDGEKHEEA